MVYLILNVSEDFDYKKFVLVKKKQVTDNFSTMPAKHRRLPGISVQYCLRLFECIYPCGHRNAHKGIDVQYNQYILMNAEALAGFVPAGPTGWLLEACP